jgi:hypothetical protein
MRIAKRRKGLSSTIMAGAQAKPYSGAYGQRSLLGSSSN